MNDFGSMRSRLYRITCLCGVVTAGFDLVVLDNLNNSSITSLERVAEVVNVEMSILNEIDLSYSFGMTKSRFVFVKGDIRNQALLCSIFDRFEVETLVHFAGLKAVDESLAMPLRYWGNNVSGNVALLEVLAMWLSAILTQAMLGRCPTGRLILILSAFVKMLGGGSRLIRMGISNAM